MVKEIKRILLVEDSPHDVELTLDALSEYKLANNVDVVRDGEEALNYLNREGSYEKREKINPALVMLDIKLPKINGLEVLKMMRQDERFRLIPVVMLTSSRENRDLEEAYNLGTNAYVVKPVDFHDFIEAVRHLGIFWGLINEPPLINL
jgi:CheY-like chemotaxis protein